METIINSKEFREVICIGCGVIRMSVVDFEKCKAVGRLVAKPCPVCSCPFILIKTKGTKK
jgi:hypothetical protein